MKQKSIVLPSITERFLGVETPDLSHKRAPLSHKKVGNSKEFPTQRKERSSSKKNTSFEIKNSYLSLEIPREPKIESDIHRELLKFKSEIRPYKKYDREHLKVNSETIDGLNRVLLPEHNSIGSLITGTCINKSSKRGSSMVVCSKGVISGIGSIDKESHS